jgi:hypothetical protein
VSHESGSKAEKQWMRDSRQATAMTVTSSQGRRPWSPLTFALDRLFPKRGRAPYATVERLVVLVVIRAMSFDPAEGTCDCFLSYPTIARWSGVSLASVKRALQKHLDGPAPLIARSKPGQTRGHRHACCRFTLVTDPERFAAGRDAARDRHRQQLDHARRDLQPERIALQRQRQDFGGTLSEAEYTLRLKALEDALGRKTCAHASLKRPPPPGTRSEDG